MLPRAGGLRYEVRQHGHLRDSGRLPNVADAGTFLAERLAELGGPGWDAIEEV